MASKLVRDYYPDIFEKEGKQCVFHIADDSEYRQKLFEKLQEEATECAEAKNAETCAEELADLYEVIDAICVSLGVRKDTIDWWRQKKAFEKGTFQKRIIFDVVKDPY